MPARSVVTLAPMRSPLRPIPAHVVRWGYTLRGLRWLDASVGWLSLWGGLETVIPGASSAALAAFAAGLLMVARLAPGLRRRWRPVSAVVSVMASASLRPGSRAWYVRASDAELVIVTGRRGLRLVIATPGHGGAEGITVRRTRVLVLPAE